MIVRAAWDLLQWCGLLLRPRESLKAEILFLRRQLALYRERGVKPRRVAAEGLDFPVREDMFFVLQDI
jgi:hypothetical protein